MPHEFTDCFETLVSTTQVPNQQSFYSTLSNKSISDVEYEDFKNTWRILGIKSLLELYEVRITILINTYDHTFKYLQKTTTYLYPPSLTDLQRA